MSSFYPFLLSANTAWICATAKAAFLAYCCTLNAQRLQLVHSTVIKTGALHSGDDKSHRNGALRKGYIVWVGICEWLPKCDRRANQENSFCVSLEGNNMSLCHQTFQVPKMQVPNLIADYFGGGSGCSLT